MSETSEFQSGYSADPSVGQAFAACVCQSTQHGLEDSTEGGLEVGLGGLLGLGVKDS